MIEKTDFPYTLGGYVEQQNYKGFDNNTVLEKGLYYYQGNDFASELVYSISRLCEPCLEHIDNNFNPLDAIQKGEFSDVSEDITYLIQQCRKKMENNEYNDMEEEVRRANDLNGQLSLLKRKELQRIQSQEIGRAWCRERV